MKNVTEAHSSLQMTKFITTGVVLTALSFASSALMAKELKLTYRVDSSLIYQSNPGFSPTDKKSVFTARFKPSVNFNYGDELDQYNLNVAVAVIENSNEDFLVDYVAPNINANWERTLEYGEVGVEGLFSRIASRAESLTINGNNQVFDNITESKTVRGYFNYDLNANWSVLTEARYSMVEYSENVGNLSDFDRAGADVQLVYKTSDLFAVYGKAGYEDFDPDSSLQQGSELYSLVAGGIYTPSENINIDFNIGGFDVSGARDDSGLQLGLTGEYLTERYTFSSEIYRRSLSGGNGIYQVNEHFDVGGKYDLDELTSLNAGYIRNKTKPQAGTVEVLAQRVTVGADRTYQDWTAGLFVSYAQLETNGNSENQNIIGFTITYNPFAEDDDSGNVLFF